MGRTALLVAGLVLAGCTPSPVEPVETPPVEPTPPVERVETPETPRILVTHHHSPLRVLSADGAVRLLGSGSLSGLRLLTDRSDVPAAQRLGDAAAVVARVRRDPNLIGYVPVSAVDETVRPVRVGSVDPLRDPAAYPLRSEVAPPDPDIVTLAITGDLMLGRRVGAHLREAGGPTTVFRPFLKRLAAADITVGNLESTLSQRGSPTQGGDSFGADPNVRGALRAAGFDVIGLANNHVGDFGAAAMRDTFRLLREGGLPYVGAGRNRAEAERPLVVERGDTSVGFLAVDSIGESPAATGSSAGTSRLDMPPRTGPMDEERLARLARQVRALARKVDIVIVLTHWGTQYTNVPEPSQRRVARVLAQAGADVVVGGHPHWLQGLEQVGDTLVAHSLGNFVFDMDLQQRTREGAVLELVLWDGVVKGAQLVPYVIGDDFTPRPVRGGRAERILATAWETSRGPYALP
ncbi:CapA family protein [Mumia sp. ZJ1417]|uniref:CapA family protein n=1 Tax=Mumia sp. ZJ1417 TaxID=2708082 RepID=UPI00141FE3FF|nr:CapA family protein [Mumia sp. ZJ1417]QMW64968.1 CapA family protein [Mumia sp. ZJ1417]